MLRRNYIISFSSSFLFLTIFSLFSLSPSRSCRWFWIYQGHWTRGWLEILLLCLDLLFMIKDSNPFLNALFLLINIFWGIPVCLLVFCFKSQLSKTLQHYLIFCTFTYLVCVFPSSVALYTSGLMAQGFQKDFWVFQYIFFPFLSIWWVKDLPPYPRYRSIYLILFPSLKYKRIKSFYDLQIQVF